MFTYKNISPTDAKNRFSQLLEQVAENHQVFIINRREAENVALIAESDLTSLVETVYLLRNPANGRRLLDAIAESKTGKIQPQSSLVKCDRRIKNWQNLTSINSRT